VSSARPNGLSAVGLHPPSRPVVIVDASALTNSDPAVLETVMRLQLDALRRGESIRISNAPRELVDLLVLFGLSDVLAADARCRVESGVEMARQIEQREQACVDEEVDPGDATG
jgi:ABC-type transporter Mla MlaB component